MRAKLDDVALVSRRRPTQAVDARRGGRADLLSFPPFLSKVCAQERAVELIISHRPAALHASSETD